MPNPFTSPLSPEKSARRRAVLIAVGVALALVIVWRFWPGGGADRGAGRQGRGGPAPVRLATAARADIPIVLDGLGTVVPRDIVTVQSRVDGQLMRVLFQEGQMVNKGDLLAEIDPRPFAAQLAQAEGQLTQAKAQLKNAELDLKRYQQLVAQDSIAAQQVDTQRALVQQYQGAVTAAEGAAASARLQLEYCRITAPMTGRVGLRQVDPGNMVRAGDAGGLVVMTQTQPATVVFAVPQDNLPALMRRQLGGAALKVEAWDRGAGRRLAMGKLIAIDSVIDTATGTVKLKAQFENADNALFANQFVNARLLLDTLHGITAVPTAAVQRGANGAYVYVVAADQTVTVRPLKIGPTDGDLVAVEQGLQPGEKVVVDGVDKLRPGAKVVIAPMLDDKARPQTGDSPRGRAAQRHAGQDG